MVISSREISRRVWIWLIWLIWWDRKKVLWQKKVLWLFMVSDGLVHQSVVFLICSSNLVCALNRWYKITYLLILQSFSYKLWSKVNVLLLPSSPVKENMFTSYTRNPITLSSAFNHSFFWFNRVFLLVLVTISLFFLRIARLSTRSLVRLTSHHPSRMTYA